mmetsp:Transcript_16519/g.26836  ORF Transcript_16519/g.26836 Transcript_16519/m.26836 type:complete len:254 (-) Transcript_16519:694-1455(-)
MRHFAQTDFRFFPVPRPNLKRFSYIMQDLIDPFQQYAIYLAPEESNLLQSLEEQNHDNDSDFSECWPEEIKQGSFEDHLFQPRYQRNNKCSGLKNLRCFPNCAPVHRSKRFCGQPVIFTANRASIQGPLLCWGRFDKLEKGYLGITVGTVVQQSKLTSNERKRGRPFQPWYRGELILDNKHTARFQFNSDHQGWHYSWVATKYTCNEEHVFRAYLFTPTSESKETVTCIGIHASPSFTIYCRRRQRFRKQQET